MSGEVHRTWRPGWPCPATAVLRQQRHGAGDPSYAVTLDGAHWRAQRTPEGPATLRVLARPHDGEVDLTCWGPGADWLAEAAPGLLGAADDVTGFRPHHPVVRDVWRRHGAWRLGRSGVLLDALVPAVIEQKVTGQEAFASYAALLRRYGEPAPGPEPGDRPVGGRARTGAGVRPGRPLLVPPAPGTLALVPSWEWLALGIDPGRSRTLVRVARVADSLERAVGLEPAEVTRRLRTVPGVGVWTAAETTRRALGDADAVSFGDYHVAKDVGWALVGEPVDDAGMAELLEPYRPHRARVPELLAVAGLRRPRHGARMSPRTHLPVRRRGR
ncbi:DNA-3-methyladenine glycosylase 2 family protein [Nocardioides sp. ChNu-153]|uniref:DNA-3-methyladenine glycosylase family protein n=1 Tax=Nocardioides sp. ChNu-153 TaxID=2779364 RepID=UPI002652745C|nr:DNA-3-methyladenine glycosylase 2 family protein [Nocardioides sp. ChNu-153]MDN7121786.1 DNA-3-methyladenine glycosylase 2 family protein [Nocardioides sp. ChNu-153]